jgi:hypothetical protein
MNAARTVTATFNLMPTSDTAITSGPAEGQVVHIKRPTFGFSADIAGATFECSLDGADFTACANPFRTPELSEDVHTLRVRAVLGDTPDASPAVRTFIVDAIAPHITSIDRQPVGNPIASSTVTFTFLRTEASSTAECSLDGADWMPCTSPATYTGLANRTHYWRIRAVDVSGRRSEIDQRNFTVRVP